MSRGPLHESRAFWHRKQHGLAKSVHVFLSSRKMVRSDILLTAFYASPSTILASLRPSTNTDHCQYPKTRKGSAVRGMSVDLG